MHGIRSCTSKCDAHKPQSVVIRKLHLLQLMGASAGSNVVSVAEHVVMLILSLVRNYLPAHKQIVDGGWDIGQAAEKAYDLQNKVVGCVGTGRIGQLVLERLKVGPYDCCEPSCNNTGLRRLYGKHRHVVTCQAGL